MNFQGRLDVTSIHIGPKGISVNAQQFACFFNSVFCRWVNIGLYGSNHM
nr:MAG TPA: hypothetical protein [Caudoviricetes sp.]